MLPCNISIFFVLFLSSSKKGGKLFEMEYLIGDINIGVNPGVSYKTQSMPLCFAACISECGSSPTTSTSLLNNYAVKVFL